MRHSLFRSISAFGYLNCTQFLGALNDNIFKLLIVFCFINSTYAISGDTVLAAGGAIYVIPFLLFASTAGTIADRYSKREVIVFAKYFEFAVLLFGMLGFFLLNETMVFITLFLLGTHSSILGPCKYGIVPEIVSLEYVSKANGLLTTYTYGAIIGGTFLAAFLTQITSHNFVAATGVCALFSLVGLYSALHLPKTAAADPSKPISTRFIAEHIRTLRFIFTRPPLLAAVFGSAFFLFAGSFVQLNIIPFAMSSLALSDVEGGYLFLLTAIGIGVGALLAGKVSGKAVEPGLVPIGGFGMGLCCFLIGFSTNNLILEMILIFIIGFFGGLYVVPLDSFIQVASPRVYLGQVVGLTYFLGFCGVLCSSGLLYLLNQALALSPTIGFFVLGTIVIITIAELTRSFAGYLSRFGAFLFARLRYTEMIQHQPHISTLNPSLFFIQAPFWPWSIVLVSCQRRPMHFFLIKSEKMGSAPVGQDGWQKRLRRWLLLTTTLEHGELLRPGSIYATELLSALQSSTSVAIFCDKEAASMLRGVWKPLLDEQHMGCFQVEIQQTEAMPIMDFQPI